VVVVDFDIMNGFDNVGLTVVDIEHVDGLLN
jgi:hypothetical protein